MKKLFLVSILLASPAAWGGLTTGNQLQQYMSQEADADFTTGFALGFISAVAEEAEDSTINVVNGIKYIHKGTHQEKREVLSRIIENYACLPVGTTRGQLLAVVKKWFASHPERWNENATELVKAALIQGFPCRSVDELLK
jgi:hypothetical protein